MEVLQQRLDDNQDVEGQYLAYLLSNTQMSMKDVYGNISELLLAGVDTVKKSLAFMLISVRISLSLSLSVDIMTCFCCQDLQHPHMDFAPAVQEPSSSGQTLRRSVRAGASGPDTLCGGGHSDAVLKGCYQGITEVRPSVM